MIDPGDRCTASVPYRGGGFGRSHQCSRRAVVFSDDGEDGYCRQHDPERIEERDLCRDRLWHAEARLSKAKHNVLMKAQSYVYSKVSRADLVIAVTHYENMIAKLLELKK